MDLLSNLNPVQRQAVEHPGGPVLIVAGAGSGKTRVLTRRIAYLLEKGTSPMEIFAVTFTNKAAQEMKNRVSTLSHQDLFWVGTFHSICVKILRRHAAEIGYQNAFGIYDDQDQKAVIKDCLKELKLDSKDFKPVNVMNHISRAKDSLIGCEEFAKEAAGYHEEIIAKIYTMYEKKLKLYHAFDFGDLIMKTVYLFEENPKTLEAYQEKFRHILVDEYQDTNQAQYKLVKLLSEKHKNIYVVGDPDQSIYRWRGADIKNILNFEDDFEGTTVINMEQNYRSTQTILKASNHVISNNSQRKPKNLWTEREEGDKIAYYLSDDEQGEGQYVVESINHAIENEGKSLNDIVVFYRVHAQSRVLENALRRGKIPYKIIGGISFYSRKEIKDVMAYMKLTLSPQDDINLKRVINVPARGIGQSSIARLEERAMQQGLSLHDAILDAMDDPMVQARLKKNLSVFMQVVQTLTEKASDLTVTQLLQEVLRTSGYVEMLEAQDDTESEERLENVKELISATEEFEEEESEPTLANFLEQMTLKSHIDSYQDQDEQLTLMTLHSAKGLEFPYVFIVGFEEELFPHSNSSFESDELEEERRLCYVGMTRAEQRLFLSGAQMRRLFGERTPKSPSRFLAEIPTEYVEFNSASHYTPTWNPEDDDMLYNQDHGNTAVEVVQVPVSVGFEEGEQVTHPEFGVGQIQEVSGEGASANYSVLFVRYSEPKLLSAKYARLTKY